MNKADNENGEMRQVLGLNKRPSIWKRRFLVVVILLIAVTGTVYWRMASSGGKTSIRYRTAAVVKGDLVVSVSATGTLEPVNSIDVGTELSGTLRTVEVDFNDPVEKGQVLARLDTDKLEAQKLQYEAALAVAKADLRTSQATVSEAKTSLDRLKNTYRISGGKLPSQQDLDSADAAYNKALAQEEGAAAGIAKAQAALDANDSDLAKAVIRAPISGMVLNRQVEPGQTVAASLQTPVLFTLAEDLTHMSLCVAVDEADVGQVKEGQPATFLVDAYPNREFPARITQVRYTPQTDSGVVTYECLLSVDNSELLLRPGMTATADIMVNHIQNAILVPNAALRFTPVQTDISADTSQQPQRSLLSRLLPGAPRGKSGNNKQAAEAKPSSAANVWLLKDGQPVAAVITPGASDGIRTEIIAGDLHPGQELIVDTEQVRK